MEIDNETQSVVDYSIADHEFMAVVPAVFQAILSTPALTHSAANRCDSLNFISGDTSDYSPNPVLQFQSALTSCPRMQDGKQRSGKILLRVSGAVNTPGSQVILKLQDYVSEGIQYTCDSLVMTTSETGSGYTVFNVKLINGTCRTSDYTIKYRFDRLFAVHAADAVTYVYGQSSGTNRQGINFSTNVSESNFLIKNSSCRFVAQGRMTLTPEGFKERLINFGDGSCDDLATFTVNENTVAFKLK